VIVVVLLITVGKSGSTNPIPLRRPVPAACTEHWVGSWEASPSGVSLDQPLLDRTVRMIIAPHLGGTRLRVRLTNRYGTVPVTLGPVTIGVRASGASLVPGSERAVRFGRRSLVTIPAGGEVLSGPVNLRFSAFLDLAVSVFVRGLVKYPTDHFTTRQTSYFSPPRSGDHAPALSGTAFTEKTTGKFSTGWYFLDGIDVLAPGRVGAVVAFGDSITDGFQGKGSAGTEQFATINVNGRYPDDLAHRLFAAKIPLSVLNAGITGNQLIKSGLPLFGPSGLSRFRIDALAQSGVSDVIVLEGINDIAQTPPASASRLIAAYEKLISEAHAAGVAIQLGTLTPTGGAASAAYGDAAANTVRERVNRWIRSQHLSDGIVDFDAAVRDPSDPRRIDPAYDGSDHLHFNLAGYRVLAGAVNLVALARPDCLAGAQRP